MITNSAQGTAEGLKRHEHGKSIADIKGILQAAV